MIKEASPGQGLGGTFAAAPPGAAAARKGSSGVQIPGRLPEVTMLLSKSKKLIGQLLIEAGLLSPVDLDAALREQRGSKARIGEILVQKRVLEEDQLLTILCKQLRVKRFNPNKFPPNPQLKEILPEAEASRLQVVPVFRKGSLLLVAMRDPADIAVIDALERLTKLEVEPLICNEKELRDLAVGVYGPNLRMEAETLSDIPEVVEQEEETAARKEDVLDISSLQSQVEDAPVIKIVNAILVQALQRHASDIHINPKEGKIDLRFRIDGELREIPAPPKNYFTSLVSRIKLLSNLDISVTRTPQDGRFTYRVRDKEVSVRTSTLPTIFGEKVVMRLHVQSSKGLSLEQLGMGDRERELLQAALLRPHGMILATGPTGSGKSTLLYAMLEKICSPNINIVTLEDPVETRLPEVTQVQLNSKAGMTFASGLRSILRQDPDVIMVGEIRDEETARISIQAAMTGHKLLSTLHTNDAAGAVSRFIEMGIEPFLIASTMVVVVAQRLVRRICPDCVEAYRPDAVQLQNMIRKPGENKDFHFFRGKGCFKCEQSGFKGRVGVYEVLNVDNAVKDLIIRRASAHEIRQRAIQSGRLRTLKMDAAFKVLSGVTTFEEYLGVAL